VAVFPQSAAPGAPSLDAREMKFPRLSRSTLEQIAILAAFWLFLVVTFLISIVLFSR